MATTTPLSLANILPYCLPPLPVIDHTLSDFDLEARCPLDHGTHPAHPTTPSLGTLSSHLPPELTDHILTLLDIPSLTTFRRVSQQAMLAVDSLPSYHQIRASCPDILRAILGIHATSFSLLTLFSVLTAPNCDTCGQFGGYLYLITCRRVCYRCFTTHKAYLPVSRNRAAEETKLPWEALRTLPTVRSLEGTYTAVRKTVGGRIFLVDREALVRLCGGGWLDTSFGDATTAETRRFMAVVSAPRVVRGGGGEWGVFCGLCLEVGREVRRQYGREEVVGHFRSLHAAQVAASLPS